MCGHGPAHHWRRCGRCSLAAVATPASAQPPRRPASRVVSLKISGPYLCAYPCHPQHVRVAPSVQPAAVGGLGCAACNARGAVAEATAAGVVAVKQRWRALAPARARRARPRAPVLLRQPAGRGGGDRAAAAPDAGAPAAPTALVTPRDLARRVAAEPPPACTTSECHAWRPMATPRARGVAAVAAEALCRAIAGVAQYLRWPRAGHGAGRFPHAAGTCGIARSRPAARGLPGLSAVCRAPCRALGGFVAVLGCVLVPLTAGAVKPLCRVGGGACRGRRRCRPSSVPSPARVSGQSGGGGSHSIARCCGDGACCSMAAIIRLFEADGWCGCPWASSPAVHLGPARGRGCSVRTAVASTRAVPAISVTAIPGCRGRCRATSACRRPSARVGAGGALFRARAAFSPAPRGTARADRAVALAAARHRAGAWLGARARRATMPNPTGAAR